uniref:Uncharacterized protein n=1 Tax=Sphaerodactylus townsendi TaxID=933632 RepID=A0ACB8FXN2_9SAUR
MAQRGWWRSQTHPGLFWKKAIHKSKESVLSENERGFAKYQSATQVDEDPLEDSVLLPLDPTLECHSPPPDYSSVIQYSPAPSV